MELFIRSLLVSAVVGISILFILPVMRKEDPFLCDKLVGVSVPLNTSIAWEGSLSEEEAKETQKFSADPAINNKIKAIVTGLPKSIVNLFLEFSMDHDKKLVADSLDSCLKQENFHAS
jgi:hypothetical protein